ncbi:MAG: nucleotidyl transferase AbiEii/AbiGii toxin family protein [Gammaproteobacteria bacterium]|nr:nucleotidyl transferase AbiEii/AbiGii toxin family protein [Gammaproteobacteria bacterium]
MAVAETPIHTEFMDADMRLVWDGLGPMPGDLRLYGGTALALYRNHRASTDFDFVTPIPGIVDLDFVNAIPYFDVANAVGGTGMVDAEIVGQRRSVAVTFLETGRLFAEPTREPLVAANGVAVAHPVDLVASKLWALVGRDELRDYVDLAESIRAWPCEATLAAGILPGQDRSRSIDVARLLSGIPRHVSIDLGHRDHETIRSFAARLLRPSGAAE